MDSGDWRNHLEPGFRRDSLRTIVQGLIRHFPGVCDEPRLIEFKRIALKVEASFYGSSNSLEDYQSRLSQMIPAIEAKARNFARNPFDKCPLPLLPQNDKASPGNASSNQKQLNKHHSDQKTQHPIAKPLTQQLLPPQQAVTTQVPPFQRLIQALKRPLLELPTEEQFNHPRTTESDDILLKEINKINELLIDTVVEISKQGVHEGTIVYCRFKPVSFSPNMKSFYELAPFQPIRLLIPETYPNHSPIFLEDFPVEAGSVSGFCNEASVKARSRFRFSLRTLSEPLSITEIANAWDLCAREAISEFAQQYGGGNFSNKYGGWSCCLAADSRTYLARI